MRPGIIGNRFGVVQESSNLFVCLPVTICNDCMCVYLGALVTLSSPSGALRLQAETRERSALVVVCTEVLVVRGATTGILYRFEFTWSLSQ